MRLEVWDPFPDKAGESTLMSRSGGEKGLRLSGAGKLVFRSSETGKSGKSLNWIKGVKYCSNFKREPGIALENLQREGA